METLFEVKKVLFENQIEYPEIVLIENEITFLRGESGCGKSTLLKLLNGFVSPSHGVILFHGMDIQKMSTIELRRRVLLVSQNAYLFTGSIEENFRMYYQYRETTAPARAVMQDFLRGCCVSFALEHDCGNLSGGERQRIFIAICISFCPEVLLLDEPTSALDAQISRNMMQYIVRCCKKNSSTLIVVSHDSSLAEEFSDTIWTLENRRNR